MGRARVPDQVLQPNKMIKRHGNERHAGIRGEKLRG